MLKKSIAVLTILSALFGFALTAHAELFIPNTGTYTVSTTASTDISTLEAQAQELIKQVADLRARLSETQRSNAGLKAEVVAMRAELKLMRTLKLGDQNSDVTLLQQVLATDPTIYPEGKVTGYFGSMTAAAVKRFQEKAGLEKVGQVGPKTMEKLNMIMRDSDDTSGKIPEGLLKDHGTFALVKLSPLGDSGVYAHARLHADGTGKTRVIVEVIQKQMMSTNGAVGAPDSEHMAQMPLTPRFIMGTSSYPAHIHAGACPQSGGVVYPLSPVVNGRSETLLLVNIEDILKGLPLSLNMHKSGSDLSPIACGNVEIPSLVWKAAASDGTMLLKTSDDHPESLLGKCPNDNWVKTMGSDGAAMMKCVPQTSATSTDGDVHVITLAASSFKFSTNEITVKKGQKVRVVLKVVDGFHDFVVDEFAAHTEKVGAGKVTYAEFTPDRTGTFEFYCSVGTHRAMGMVGKLIVVE